ncbi:MAG TPA: VWA domain-containing protein, partial [Terriglobales bacterium]
HAQSVGHLRISLELRSAHALADVRFSGAPYKMNVLSRDAHTVKASFEGEHVALTEDFGIQYALDAAGADKLSILTHRDPDSGQPDAAAGFPERSHNEPGFFEAQLLLGTGRSQNTAAAPQTVIILFDNSLSMQWDKLERSYAAMEQLLRSLRPADSFNLLLFNNSVAAFQPAPVTASRENVQKALDFVRASRLRGGTNLEQALSSALGQCNGSQHGDNYVVLLSDGGATRGTIHSGHLAKWYGDRWKQLPQSARPRTYVFAVGDDANLPLLRMLSRNEGTFENVLSTEPIEFKLNAFISKIGRTPVAQLGLSVAPESAVQMVYPLQDTAFAGGLASWVGQYSKPSPQARMTVSGIRDGVPLQVSETAELPAKSLEHPQLPRLWARARVDALLEKIERDGEDAKSIDEIIRLSRKYKFVTPYTSFLAVPRALLRPRVIRPGDPVLRVHTDESIKSVVAIFPFGLTKRLRYLDSEDVWQTRFLAPEDLNDGTYNVRLILRDSSGHTYRESKSFVIASKPPVVNIRLQRTRYHRGETIPLKVNASASTRTLMARMEGASPVPLRWNSQAGANTGELRVPADLPSGTYHLTVIAEDIAHNVGTQEVQLEVLP